MPFRTKVTLRTAPDQTITTPSRPTISAHEGLVLISAAGQGGILHVVAAFALDVFQGAKIEEISESAE